MTKHNIAIILSITYLMLGVHNLLSQHCDLTRFYELNSKAKTIEYQHIRGFDNKFNSTFTHDTSYITIFKLEDGKTGFQILNKGYEWFYNSVEFITLNHVDKTKSIETTDAVSDFPLWDKNLLNMFDSLSNKKCTLKPLDNVLYQHFSNQLVSISKVDTGKVLINEFEYLFPKFGLDNCSHREIIIRDGDTLQVQNHFYQHINFQSPKVYTTIHENISKNQYKVMEDDEYLPWGKKPIQEGDELGRAAFNDIENNTIPIIGKEKKDALIIFSFIGCTPCEIALNQLKEDKLGLKNKVNLYYSSFQNNNAAIKKYLENKKIFQNAFAMESNMIIEFRLPVSPTFVLIDPNGKVKKIIEGFDDSVFNTLNEAVETK